MNEYQEVKKEEGKVKKFFKKIPKSYLIAAGGFVGGVVITSLLTNDKGEEELKELADEFGTDPELEELIELEDNETEETLDEEEA